MAKAMVVAGVMSGTSADGVDVAVCRIGPGRSGGDSPRVRLIGHLGVAYPKAVRAAVLRVMEGEAVTAAEMSRLNWRLGAIYADCVEQAAETFGVKVALVGCHGQTVHHEAGQTTWQIGEAAVVAERMRCPVVSDFRPADVAAGGQGAPLVPMLDWCMFRSGKVSRVLLNLGGIGNLTALPAGCGVDGVMAFDTGPGNMVIDACMSSLLGKKYDRGGAVARRGRVLGEVVERLLGERYFSALPPKSCGREEFGAAFAARLMGMCREAGGGGGDCVATATALTAASVVDAYRRFVLAHVGMTAPLAKVELCVAGGGAKNVTLMAMLREGFGELGVRVRMMEELGIPAQAKEGVAFALLAWLTWNGRVGNVPAATGAGRAVVLGEDFAGVRIYSKVRRAVRALARMPTHAIRLHGWGTRAGDGSGTGNGDGEIRGFFAALRMTSFFGAVLASMLLIGCHGGGRAAGTVVVVIESSPNNLDPRQGTDAQSERVGPLIFDALVKKDNHYNLRPWLATSWEQEPDASGSTAEWVFHLRDGVRFQDGRPLEAADVVWTIESLIDPKLTAGLPGGTLVSAKAGAFANVDHAEAPDRLTVVVHMKRPDAGLVFNLSDGLFGVVPRGSGADFGLHPVGSGPYRFVSQVQDKDVVVARWDGCWSAGMGVNGQRAHTEIRRVEFEVVPDTITSALELQKHSADAASNVLTPDMVYALRDTPGLKTATGTGSNVWYLNFNVEDGVLKDKRVRQAVALAIDRPAIMAALWRGNARLADSLLPPGHWARAEDAELTQYPHDPARAAALLEAAGYPAGRDGVRLTLALKISTDEQTRLLAAVLQEQMRAAGIALNIRSAEFGTFYSDVTRGAFQMYVLKWVGSNEDPDIFRYMYSSKSFPPKGANRGHYVNPAIDALLAKAATETGPADEVQARRRGEYIEVQKIVAEEMPSVPLWYPDNEVVHTDRLRDVVSDGDGNFDFLR